MRPGSRCCGDLSKAMLCHVYFLILLSLRQTIETNILWFPFLVLLSMHSVQPPCLFPWLLPSQHSVVKQRNNWQACSVEKQSSVKHEAIQSQKPTSNLNTCDFWAKFRSRWYVMIFSNLAKTVPANPRDIHTICNLIQVHLINTHLTSQSLF